METPTVRLNKKKYYFDHNTRYEVTENLGSLLNTIVPICINVNIRNKLNVIIACNVNFNCETIYSTDVVVREIRLCDFYVGTDNVDGLNIFWKRSI